MANLKTTEILDVINEHIVPNLQGETITVNELTDVTTVGEALTSMGASALKDYTNTFITKAIKSLWNLAEVELLKLPIYKDSLTYGAVLQSIYRKGTNEAEESSAFALVNGQEYDIETYHGFEFDVKVYSNDTSFRLVYSIPNTLYESAFTPDGILELTAYLHECVNNDMIEKINGLVLTALQCLIFEHRNKRVKLVTLYNTLTGVETPWTYDTLKASPEDFRAFSAFAKSTIVNGRRGMLVRSKKYNDGTVLASTPTSRNNLVMLGQFVEDVETLAYANTYNWSYAGMPEHYIIDFWQGSGANLVPAFDSVSKVNLKVDSTSVTINGVVAVAYDDRAVAVSTAPEKVTTSYNGNGDFTTFYDYHTQRTLVDTRANAIVFTIE